MTNKEHCILRKRLAKRTKTIQFRATPELYAMLKWITSKHYVAYRYGVSETMSHTVYKLVLEGLLTRIARVDRLDEFALARLEAKLKGKSYEQL